MPFDCWEVLVTTRKLFFQTGFAEGQAVMDSVGEEMMAGVKFTLKAFNTKMLSVTELFACNNLMAKYKVQMAEFWNSTMSKTSTGRAIDAILCPSSAVVGSKHDTPGYVGYTSLFNILDYPAATIPWKEFTVSESKDPKDAAYRPLESNPYDKLAHDACKSRYSEVYYLYTNSFTRQMIRVSSQLNQCLCRLWAGRLRMRRRLKRQPWLIEF